MTTTARPDAGPASAGAPDPSGARPGEPAAAGVAERLRAAFATGRTRPLEWRRAQLRALVELLGAHEAELLDALAADVGKPPIEAYVTDLAFTASEARHALAHLEEWTKPARVPTPLKRRPGRARIVAEPAGAVLVIGPWNYPVQLVLAPLVAAVAAGNCVAVKPSEVAPAVSAALARLLPEHLDPECIAVVEGGVPETTALLAERWDHIFYTGNGTVGRVVMAAAARHLTPVTLELGGKSPTIVDRHANLEVAARRIAWGKYLNAGQTCIAPDYVLVDEQLRAPFLDALARHVTEFYGPDPRTSPDYARIVNERHLARLVPFLDDGEVVFGGDVDAPARYLAPTALRDVDVGSAVMAGEIFGPILPVLPVADVDEAIEFVNAREKPLALYVFSEDHAIQDHVVAATSSGGVCVNATMFHLTVPELPFGGVGPSGMGAYHGRAGFETFSHRKSVFERPSRPDPAVAYPPYRGWKQRILRRML